MKFFQRSTAPTPPGTEPGAHEWAEFNLPADFRAENAFDTTGGAGLSFAGSALPDDDAH